MGMRSKIEGSIGGFLGYSGILLGGSLALFFLNVLNSSYSTVLVMIKREFELSYTLSGALMSSYFVGYTIGQIPYGYLADRYGSRRAIAVSVLGAASSTLLFGFSSDNWQVIVTRFLTGLLGAGIFVPCVKLVSSWFSPRERGTALGILNIGGSVGLVVASWATPILATYLGWRGSMVMLALIGMLSSFIIWLKLKEGGAPQPSGSDAVMVEVVRSREFWIIALTQFIRLGSYYTFIAWLPLILQEEYGLSLLAAGTAFSLFNSAGLLSNPLGGLLSDRFGEKLVLVGSFFILTVTVIAFMSVNAYPILFVTAFIIGWFINFVRSPSFTILPKLYGTGAAGKISGISNTFASLGALLLPLLLGYVRDLTASYQVGWTALSALLLIGSVINLFIRGL